MPEVFAVIVAEEVVEAVGTAVCTGVPARGVPDAVEEGKGKGLVEDDEGVAGLAERVEEGDLPGSDRVQGSRGHGGADSGSKMAHSRDSGHCINDLVIDVNSQ